MTSDLLTAPALAAATSAQPDPDIAALMLAASAEPAGIDRELVAFHVARLVNEESPDPTWTRALADARTRSRMTDPGYLGDVQHRQVLVRRVQAVMDPDSEVDRAVAAWLAGVSAGDRLVAAASAVAGRGALRLRVLAGAWWSVYAGRVVGLLEPERLGRGRQSAAAAAELERRRAIGTALLDTRLWTPLALSEALAVSRVTAESWRKSVS